MTWLILPPAAEHLCDVSFEGDIAMQTPASKGFPGGRRNTASFCQPQQKGSFHWHREPTNAAHFYGISPIFQKKSQDLWDSPALSYSVTSIGRWLLMSFAYFMVF